MKRFTKRFGALLLSVALLVMMMPAMALTANAAGTLNVSDPNIGLSWTDASNSSGKASWTASGTTITGTATGYKVLGLLSRTVTTKLTITNNYADARTLSFTYALSGGGSVSGISGNAYNAELAAGGTLTITLTSPSGTSTNTLTISDIQLIGNNNVTTTFVPAENGSYTVDGTAVTAQVSYEKEPTASSYTLAATPASGYTFFCWYDEVSGNNLSYDASATLPVGSDMTIKPIFIAEATALFGVGSQRFYDLTAACAVASAGTTKTVVALNNGTLSGAHTIPAGVTLLVPYNDANSIHGSNPSCTSYNDLLGGNGHIAWVQPTAYRTLTMAADAQLTVNGVIEVGGRHASAAGAKGMHGGSPTGPLGYINMLPGSHIDLNSGATLYCWGYIYGDGTITAKSGSAVYENFQIQDFRGGDKSTELAEGLLVFPTAQYYVQNVEVATRYEYGSTEYVHTSVYMSRMEHGATVQFIGTDAMFRPQPDSYVVKDYDPTTDSLYLDSYGDCALSELAMSIAGVAVDAGEFVLPITNNMHIRIKSGTATLQQNVMMLPGSSLTVDQGATLNLAYTDVTGNVVTAGGYILQMFDYDNYTYGIDQDTFEVVTDRYYNHYGNTGKRRFQAVPYTCTTRKIRTEADLVDAKLDVNGTVISNGYIYSTVDYADIVNEDYTITGGGANIISSEGTGSIQMVQGSGGDIFGVMYDQDCAEAVDKGGVAGDGVYYYIPLASAQLRNGDGTLLDTTGTEAGTTYAYCATHDVWYTGECAACTDPCYNGHTPGAAADCENPQVCTVCGDQLAAALGHTYDNACDEDCNVCGATRTVGDHAYTSAVTKNPTCDETGVRTYTCSVCGDSYTETIAALGHDYKGVVTAPDCVNGGYTTYTCATCGASYVADETDALGHDYKDVVTAPDCENGGYTTYTCATCGDSYVADETDALGHDYKDVVTAPDCENGGYTTYTCATCGASYVADETAALSHTYDHEYDVDCNTCGAIREVAIPITFGGRSVSEDISGLAFKFDVAMTGMTVNGTTAIYDAAYVGEHKLVRMGAVVSNGKSTTDVNAVYLCALDEVSASFAVRVIHIPEAYHDAEITAVPYIVIEIDGEEVRVEGDLQSGTYNQFYNP